jgi:two-component system sensor histidine kinase KdpD
VKLLSRNTTPLEKRRKTPEDFLRECQAEEAAATQQGHLKIILGYASGVGKTHRLLDEARRRRERGQDVIVGAIQPQVPPEVDTILNKLEVIPLRHLDGGVAIDVDAIIRRHPMVCFIDGLAYDNPPAARNPTRWQDVADLLNAGIKVVASINIQYIAELRGDVEAITGKHVTQTVPIAFIKSASEIEIVDTPSEGPIERSAEATFDAKDRQQRLSKLREMTLVLAADVVDQQLNCYLEEHGIRQRSGAHERILVCITPRSNLTQMLDTAHTIAERFHAEVTAAYVDQPNLSEQDRAILAHKLDEARAAGATVEILHGENPANAILDFARSKGITQIFVGHSQRSGLKSQVWGNPVDTLISHSRGMDIRVFPQ